MTELKVQCDCGQKYSFDVEPVNNQMPFRVACPSCGVDGTEKANSLLQAQAPVAVAAPALASAGGLRLNVAPPVAAAPPPIPAAAQRYPVSTSASRMPMPGVARAPKNKDGTSNLALGIVGAVIGAAIGAGLMYGFFALTQLRFPLMGTGVGALTGLGARILYRGTDSALGAIAGGIAAAAVVGAFFLMYGDFQPFRIITVAVSVYIAYRIAA
jgi:hypothetical protein